MPNSRPDVADSLARRSLHLGRALLTDPSPETMAAVRAHLCELGVFVGAVYEERWYAPQFGQWAEGIEDFVEVLQLEFNAEVPVFARAGAVLELSIGGTLFDYRLCSYAAAAELSFRRRP